MTATQTVILVAVIVIGLVAILCLATLWAEPRDVTAVQDVIDEIDVERL